MNQKLIITKVSYTRVENLGNYENCRVEAEAVVNEGDDPNTVMKRLRKWVECQVEEAVEELADR